jgi:hypothetical protein
MDRWLEIPQLAAGPEVTPTKPIFKTGLAANAALLSVRPSTALITPETRKLRFFMKKLLGEGWKIR